MDIIDLHCDLLGYLAINPNRGPYHPQVRCSAPQLKAGNVKTQILAIAAETHYLSLLCGLKQLDIFLKLPKQYPDDFTEDNIIPAFENASAFCTEHEPLEDVFTRLEGILTKITPLYISLTWNGENRFGGGCGSDAGLKADGKELLSFLSGRGIAIDFSHTSDRLGREILNTIDAQGLDIRVMASHSNLRALQDHVRNLPDEIAKEIISRRGLIGLVFYKKFLGAPENLSKQIEYGLTLGAKNCLAFGADFFHTADLIAIIADPTGFFDELSDASKYPSLVQRLENEFPKDMLENICFNNASKFINNTTAITK